MADSALVLIRDAIVTGLQTRFPAWKVRAHGGRFTPDEIPLLLGDLPAMRVAILGVDEFSARGRQGAEVKLRCAVYVLAADKSGDPAADWALNITHDLLWHLLNAQWNGRAYSVPDLPLAAQNLYTGIVQRLRLSVWGVPFSQTFRLT